MLKNLSLIFFICLFTSNLFAQDLEYSEQVGNKYFDMNIDYKVVDKKVYLNIKTKNLQGDGKGGVSISFPDFKNQSKIAAKVNQGFDTLNAYDVGSKLWNGEFKASVKAQAFLMEGWATSWKKDEEKGINLEINIDNLSELRINVRANLTSNKQEYIFPKSGVISEQSYSSKPIVIQLKKPEKKVEKPEKFFYGKNELIEDKIFTSYEILPNNQMKLDVTFAPQTLISGGISISFPQLKDEKKIVKKSSNDFKTIGVYKAGSKIWNGNIKKTITSDYLLVEGWEKQWYINDYKTISLIVDTKDLDELKVNVRVNYKHQERFSGAEEEINIPNEGIKDQQDYYVKQLNIQTTREDFKIDIFAKINESFEKELNIIEEHEKYIFTTSNDLKIWDKNTKKLVKIFDIKVDQVLIVEDKLFYTNIDTFGYIDLNNLLNKDLYVYSDSINFYSFIKKAKSIIVPYNSVGGLYSSSFGYLNFDIKKEKVEVKNSFDLEKSSSWGEKFIFSKDLNYLFIKDIDEENKSSWYKIPRNFEAPSFFEGEGFEIKSKNIFLDDILVSDKYLNVYSSNNEEVQKHKSNTNKIINKFKGLGEGLDTDMKGSNKEYSFESIIDDNQEKETLNLINNKSAKKTKVLNRIPINGQSYSCTFSKSAMPFENHLVAIYNYEICPDTTFYIINKEGKLLRTISPELVKYGNNYYDIKNGYVELLDKDFQTIKRYKQYPNDVNNIEIKDNKVIIYSSNNQIVYYDYETQEQLYTKYIIDKDTEITVLKEGFIDGKGNFEDYIHFLDDKYKLYTINQFYDFFYRPDLVKLKLQGKDISQYTNGLTYQDALKNPPPKIDILKVENQNVTIRKDKNEDISLSKDKTTLNFNVQNNNGGIGLIRVYQEGKLIKTFGDGIVNKEAANVDTVAEQDNINEKVKLAQNEYLEKMQNSVTRGITELVPLEDNVGEVVTSDIKNNEGAYSIDLDLISGNNEISIEAFNSSNTVSSYKESINIVSNVLKKEPTLYAIVTGVNEFEASYVSNLKYSQNDANAIKELIEKEKGKSYKNIEIKYLIGKDLTKEKVNEAIEYIKQKAKLEDALVFYISTHGKNYKGKLMLVPQNNKNVKNLISFEDLFKNMQSIKTLKQVFILDTCESGSANDIVSSIYDSKASVLAKSSGVHMLLATTKGTFAFEHPNPNIKHGVFTNNIINALQDVNTDKNRDKEISIIELSKILKEPKYIVDQQYPIIRNVGNDMKVRELK